MNNELKQIGSRIAMLRDVMEKSEEELANKMEISVEEYKDLEAGKSDFAFSQLQCLSSELRVDITTLLTGEDPKLSGETVTRKGEGILFKRNEEFVYRHLAAGFKNAKATPFYVVKKFEKDKDFGIYSRHEGEEFDYIIKGSLKIDVGGNVYELNAGDSIYYNSDSPHSMVAIGGTDCEMLVLIIK